jgi:hypothetical protein
VRIKRIDVIINNILGCTSRNFFFKNFIFVDIEMNIALLVVDSSNVTAVYLQFPY